MTDEMDHSGDDLDVWGGLATAPVYVPRPRTEEACVLKVDGHCTCPPGFERCVDFAEQLRVVNLRNCF